MCNNLFEYVSSENKSLFGNTVEIALTQAKKVFLPRCIITFT